VQPAGPSLAARLAAMSEQQLRQHIVADRTRLKQMSEQLRVSARKRRPGRAASRPCGRGLSSSAAKPGPQRRAHPDGCPLHHVKRRKRAAAPLAHPLFLYRRRRMTPTRSCTPTRSTCSTNSSSPTPWRAPQTGPRRTPHCRCGRGPLDTTTLPRSAPLSRAGACSRPLRSGAAATAPFFCKGRWH
jgi:hypothetical protein